MTTLTPPQFALPPLGAIKFVPFIFLQVVLLHPAFPNSVSRPLRFLLTFPALWFSASFPFRYRIEPTHLAIGANFRLGIFGPELILKALEWGLAVDRTPYQWIGFDGLGKESVARNRAGKLRADESTPPAMPSYKDGTPKIVEDDVGEHGRAAAVKSAKVAKAGERDGPWAILLSSLHLMTAMRGIGYAFGPPAHSLAPPPPRAPLLFLRSALVTLLQAHVGNTIAIMIIINRERALPHILHTYLFPFLPLSTLTTLSHIIAYSAVPISLQFQMILGLSGVSLVFFALIHILRAVLPASLRPAPFDSREWPSLFNRPFVPRSVSVFWSTQWHHLFRKPFTFVGYDPVVRLLTPVAGKASARLAGALTVFLLSAWLHDQGMWSARHGLASPLEQIPLSFLERWGAWVFFVAQAVAVGLEGTFARVTGKQFVGRGATLWAWAWIMGVGLLAGKSWIAMGLVRDLPPINLWGWQRFVVPSAVLAPPPLWTK